MRKVEKEVLKQITKNKGGKEKEKGTTSNHQVGERKSEKEMEGGGVPGGRGK